MERPFRAYSGDEPYIFVSYAHADAAAVYEQLAWLTGSGFNVWYDEGIIPGHSWPEELAQAIQNCSVFVLFVTPQSALSEHCERELAFVLDAHKPVLAIHLAPCDLPAGMKLNLGTSQGVLKYDESQQSYEQKVVGALTEALSGFGGVTPGAGPPRRRTGLAVGAGVVVMLVVLAYLSYGAYQRFSDENWVHDVAIPEISTLTRQRDYAGAFALARRAAEILPEDLILQELWPSFSEAVVIDTEPASASVYAKPYSQPQADWIALGESPIATWLPRDAYRWRIQKDGYDTQHTATDSARFFRPGLGNTVKLVPAGEVPVGMVRIPGASIVVPFAGFPNDAPVAVGEFDFDRFEVTNEQYLEFVDAGGYDEPRFWQDLAFSIDGDDTSWEAARERFVDATGRTGPSTWELGRFREGTARHPVGGVSWYEAVAYARFRGKRLPTIHHWSLATHGPITLITQLVGMMAPLANLSGRPVSDVGQSGSMGVYGIFDSAGNVREWIWNEGSDGNRWILGGGWSEPEYTFTNRNELPAMDRAAVNGIRLMSQPGPMSPELMAKAQISTRDYQAISPVSDEGYALLVEQFDYDREAASYRTEPLPDWGDTRWEKTTLTRAAGDEFAIHLLTPSVGRAPRQAVVYFPVRGMFVSTDPPCEVKLTRGPFQTAPILRSGRVLVMPVWSGSCERYDGFYQASKKTRVRLRASHIVAWREELGRTLDYLETRDDIEHGAYAFYGASYGGSRPLPLLALEDRLKAAVIYSGGFPHGDWPQVADAVNYVQHTTLPVLMLGGRYDAYRPLESAQRPYFELLGTADAHKKFVVYDAGHAPLPATEALRETADWFDRYLGSN